MATAESELEHFYQFARTKLVERGDVQRLTELLSEWYERNSRPEINTAIRHGIEEADAGVGRPLDELAMDFRTRNGISAGIA